MYVPRAPVVLCSDGMCSSLLVPTPVPPSLREDGAGTRLGVYTVLSKVRWHRLQDARCGSTTTPPYLDSLVL